MSNINERLNHLIKIKVVSHRRFKELEDLTGISAESWRAFENGKQKPSVGMLVAVSNLWPDYLSWLMTGVRMDEELLNPKLDITPSQFNALIEDSKVAHADVFAWDTVIGFLEGSSAPSLANNYDAISAVISIAKKYMTRAVVRMDAVDAKLIEARKANHVTALG